jgi:hypothetical protein
MPQYTSQSKKLHKMTLSSVHSYINVIKTLLQDSVGLGSRVAMLLLKAVIVKAYTAPVAAFTGILVANAATLLS